MTMRITVMNSGMDTEAMVTELVKVSSGKKDKLKKAQTKLEWKQTAWKDLNAKVYSFFSKKLSDLRFEGSYKKKKTTVADSSIASVIAGDNAVNGTQTLAVERLAKSGYLTGGKLKKADSKDTAPITENTTLKDLGIGLNEKSSDATIDLRLKSGTGEEKIVSLNAESTIKDVITSLKDAGITANFDAANGRIFVSADGSGEAKDFSIKAANVSGLDALSGLGLLSKSDFTSTTDFNYDTYDWGKSKNPLDKDKEIDNKPKLDGIDPKTFKDEEMSGVRIKGQDAKIWLNGAEFTSDTNTFSINGLTITANSVSAKAADNSLIETSINTADDVDGIYNMIKDFFKEYNELIKEVETLYNAESSKGYEPLTDEEKDEMNDTEIEQWEKKIKDSLLRRDGDLGTLINTLKNGMLQNYTVGGQKMGLSSFGIATLGYFAAGENEKGMYHIDGDADDEKTSSAKDELKSKIASDPESVMSFFSQLVGGLYTSVNGLMQRTDYRSMYKVYDDKKLQTEYDDYGSKIKDQEKKLQSLEDRYYNQFTSMEKAMAKINSQQSYLSGLFGGM